MDLSLTMPSTIGDSIPVVYPWEGKARGFDRSLFTDANQEFLCSICGYIIRHPVQNLCGHRYCKACILDLLDNNESVLCPACELDDFDTGMEIDTSISLGNLRPDNATKRFMSRKKVKCPNNDCSWSGSFLEYETSHYPECEYHKMPCPDCKKIILYSELHNHRIGGCPKRHISCELCEQVVLGSDMKSHLENDCPKVEVACESCSKQKILRENLELHYRKECTVFKIPCPYNCKFVFLQPLELESHECEKLCDHANQLNKSISFNLSEYELENNVTGGRINTVNELNERVNRLSKMKPSKALPNVNPKSLIEINEVINDENEKCSSLLESLGDVDTRINNVRKKSFIHDLNYKRFMKDSDKSLTSMERTLQGFDRNIQNLQERLTQLEKASYNGEFVWRIANWSSKSQDAKSGRANSIYSPIFRTQRYGYNLRLRLYPQGDGPAKNNHLSLFIVIVKGEYDAILKWPFQNKITFSVVNNKNRDDDISDSFHPDPKSDSFSKPWREMNAATGCPYMVPLNKLTEETGFLFENNLYIKCSVDVHND